MCVCSYTTTANILRRRIHEASENQQYSSSSTIIKYSYRSDGVESCCAAATVGKCWILHHLEDMKEKHGGTLHAWKRPELLLSCGQRALAPIPPAACLLFYLLCGLLVHYTCCCNVGASGLIEGTFVGHGDVDHEGFPAQEHQRTQRTQQKA